MRENLKIGHVDAITKTRQDGPGSIFSRGWLLGYSPFPGPRILKSIVQLETCGKLFEGTKTLLTLPSLWTQRTRPQGTWKLQNSFHSANSDRRFSWKKKEERRKTSQPTCPRNRIRSKPQSTDSMSASGSVPQVINVYPDWKRLSAAFRGAGAASLRSRLPARHSAREDCSRSDEPASLARARTRLAEALPNSEGTTYKRP
jgi:hypothetical protein